MSKKDNVAAVPKYRFPEFALDASIDYVAGGFIFDPITNRNHHADLPILAITQEYGAIPRDEIDYKVSVTKKSLKAYKIVEKGDFIISLRSFQGGIEYSMYDGICSPAYIILRKKTNIIDQYYKYYFKSHRFIQDLNKDLEGIRDGKMISYGQFSSILLPKPDEEEQQKIADCLSSIDDLISVEEKKLSLLNDYKKGWMQKLFPAEGKTVPEWRFPEFRDSGEWKTTSLGEICGVLNGVGFPIKMQGNSTGKYSFFKVSDISNAVMNNGGILLKAANCIDDNVLLKLRAKTIPRGTTVFAKIGEALRLNRRAITSEECLIDNNVIGVKAKPKKADDYFIFLLLQLIDLERYCGGVIPSVKKTVIEEIEVSFISDLKEQQKIADFISGLVQLIRKQTDKIEALKQHKTALMQGLFPSVEEV